MSVSKNKKEEISIKELELCSEEEHKKNEEQKEEIIPEEPYEKINNNNSENEKEDAPEHSLFQEEGQLVVDAFQTDSEIIVQSAIAGINAEEIDISIENDILTIRGSREKPVCKNVFDKKKEYLYQECWWGAFMRKIILPEEVDSRKIKATIKKGILTIKLPIVKTDLEKIEIDEE